MTVLGLKVGEVSNNLTAGDRAYRSFEVCQGHDPSVVEDRPPVYDTRAPPRRTAPYYLTLCFAGKNIDCSTGDKHRSSTDLGPLYVSVNACRDPVNTGHVYLIVTGNEQIRHDDRVNHRSRRTTHIQRMRQRGKAIEVIDNTIDELTGCTSSISLLDQSAHGTPKGAGSSSLTGYGLKSRQ
jgi:hypothetical protein